MMMYILDHPIFEALAFALVHSLWQFTALIGLGAWWASGSSGSAIRHRVYMGVLCLLPLLFVGTFFYRFMKNTATSVAIDLEDLSGLGAAVGVTDEVAVSANISAGHFLVIAYLLGLLLVTFLSIKDLVIARRIKQYSLSPESDLIMLFSRLKEQLSLSPSLELRLSGRANSALTVGVFRPLIVLPLSLANQLSPEETEAILLHELAHVFRKDHLWNALQVTLKNLFFYHPMLYWLSRRIDREREYACDDLVADYVDRQVYARSLLRVAQFSITHKNQFVMQAQGKSQFTQRIQRLFQAPVSSAVSFGKRRLLLPFLLFLPLLFTVAITAQQQDVEEVITTEQPAKALYFLDGERLTIDQLVDQLLPDAYLQVCDSSDEQLQKINAAEGSNYTEVHRFYNNGVPLEEVTGTMEFDIVNEPDLEFVNEELSMYYNDNELTDDQAMAVAIGLMAEDMDKELQYGQFIDEVPVYGSIDDAELEVIGESIHIYDEDSPVTKAYRATNGENVDGVIKIKTAKPGQQPTQNAAQAIIANGDSILYIVDGEAYTDQTILERISPDGIESINVIKDAARLRPYGESFVGLIEIKLKAGYALNDQPAVEVGEVVDTKPLSDRKVLYIINDEVYSYDKDAISQIDPESIASVNIEKVSDGQDEAESSFEAVVRIQLKPGYDPDKAINDGAKKTLKPKKAKKSKKANKPGKMNKPAVSNNDLTELQDMFGKDINFDNTLICVDGQPQENSFSFSELKKSGIESINILRDQAQFKIWEMDPKYTAIVKIKTIKGKR